ncbi:Aminodeoxyfutalosine deaminase [Novipirellula aureliae]|uniref:Aminodeoxyfutalosine deaminase n=1 Tax=Novipirellula aureliae TaxID=2527966 RepID=A0A5C6DS15_9BACT|nr:amidohydrolase family protein [Novipirellula aureliae]TWU39035.1 Aminodeoxyfutalosine deaminase [Novipirellula aureliae]
MKKPTRTLSARWVFPVTGKPIDRGWVRVDDDRIVEVGKGKLPPGTIDLGEVVLLPQLVNAHTHLEFSDFKEPIGHVGIPLHDWIGKVIGARRDVSTADPSRAIRAGVEESAANGVALVGDIATPPQSVVTTQSGVEVVSFAETIGLASERFRERLRAATEHLRLYPDAAISPHAPYSTNPIAMEKCVGLAIQHGCPLAMHVAESSFERELLCTGKGPFAERLKALGVWQDGLFPWSRPLRKEPFQHLIALLAKAPRGLLVHGNDLRTGEIECVARHPTLTVVFCPRTHAFFGYDPHPVAEMIAAGVPVALGTDSRASNPDLSVWKEVQFLLRTRADLDPHGVLRMATSNGATSLGRPDLGRIEVGCQAKFGYVETSARSVENVFCDFATNDFRPVRIS